MSEHHAFTEGGQCPKRHLNRAGRIADQNVHFFSKNVRACGTVSGARLPTITGPLPAMTSDANASGFRRDARGTLPTITAAMPACPSCGAKDQQRVSKTRRPYGAECDVVVRYTTCQRCECRYKVEWQ